MRFSEALRVLPRVSTFQQYATLLAERGEFQRAIRVCESAICFGLDDGTKKGYEGQIERIKKAAARPKKTTKANQEELTSIDEADSPPIVARDSFSQHHRRRRRPIDAEVFQLEDVPFIPLPLAPRGWGERDAENHRKVEGKG